MDTFFMDRLDVLADGWNGSGGSTRAEYVEACRLAVKEASQDLTHHCNPRPYLENLLRVAEEVAEQIGSVGIGAIDTLNRMICVFVAHARLYPVFAEQFAFLIHVKKLAALQECLDDPELYRSSKRLLTEARELMVGNMDLRVDETLIGAAGRFLGVISMF